MESYSNAADMHGLRSMYLHRERKRAINEILGAKRAKVIAGIQDLSPVKQGSEKEKKLEDELGVAVSSLFSLLEKSKGTFDQEVLESFRRIRNLTCKSSIVPGGMLNIVITNDFLSLVIDFLNLGNDSSIDTNLYGDTLTEVLWICINMTTTSDPGQEKAIAESGLLKELLDCFKKLDQMSYTEDIIDIFTNFMCGSDMCVLYMRDINFLKEVGIKLKNMYRDGIGYKPIWIQKLSNACLLALNGKQQHPDNIPMPVKEIEPVLSAISDTFKGYDENCELWPEGLISILFYLENYLKAQDAFSLQYLLSKDLPTNLLTALPRMGDGFDKRTILCLTQFLRGLELEHFVHVRSNNEELRLRLLPRKDRRQTYLGVVLQGKV